MINAAHVLLFSTNPEADRAFFLNTLQLAHVDVGHGWLIFKLPPSELAVHPIDPGAAPAADGTMPASLYLMCDDIAATIARLHSQHVTCSPVKTERWGMVTLVDLPSGSKVGLYQPTHPTAHGL
jgi:hypothetical protein